MADTITLQFTVNRLVLWGFGLAFTVFMSFGTWAGAKILEHDTEIARIIASSPQPDALVSRREYDTAIGAVQQQLSRIEDKLDRVVESR